MCEKLFYLTLPNFYTSNTTNSDAAAGVEGCENSIQEILDSPLPQFCPGPSAIPWVSAKAELVNSSVPPRERRRRTNGVLRAAAHLPSLHPHTACSCPVPWDPLRPAYCCAAHASHGRGQRRYRKLLEPSHRIRERCPNQASNNAEALCLEVPKCTAITSFLFHFPFLYMASQEAQW